MRIFEILSGLLAGMSAAWATPDGRWGYARPHSVPTALMDCGGCN
jgi:hypothetical protein